MDLSQLIAASNQASENSAATAAGVTAAYADAITSAKNIANTEERIGVNNAIVEGQAASGNLEAQTSARRFAREAGTDIAQDSNILSLLGEQQRALALDVLEKSQRVQRLDEVAHLGNPLGFIYDAFFGESERRQLETAQDSLASVRDSIQGLNQSTQQVALTQNAIAETMTDATVAATVELQLDNAAKAAEDARMKVATLNVDMLTTVNQLGRQQLDDQFRIFQAQEMAEQRAFQRERTAALKAERLAQEDYEAARVRDYNAGAKALGLRPVGSHKEIPTSGARGARAELVMDKGYEFNQTAKLTFGQGSPVATLGFLQDFPNAEIPELQKPSIELAQRFVADYSANPSEFLKSAGLASNDFEAQQVLSGAKTAADRMALMDGAVQARFSKLVSDGADPENTTHPLAMAPIGNAAGSPILGENKFLQQYVQPLVDSDPSSMFDPGRLIELSRDAVLKGELSTDEVVGGIHSMVELLSTKTTLARGYHTVAGFPPVEALNLNLKAKVPVVGAPFGMGLIPELVGRNHTGRVNVWDRAALNKFASDYYRKSQGFSFGNVLNRVTSGGNN